MLVEWCETVTVKAGLGGSDTRWRRKNVCGELQQSQGRLHSNDMRGQSLEGATQGGQEEMLVR